MTEVKRIGAAFKEVREKDGMREIIRSTENLNLPHSTKPQRLTMEELAQQLNKLCADNGYRQTIVAVSKSGAQLPITDVMIDGFGVALILTEVKRNDATN